MKNHNTLFLLLLGMSLLFAACENKPEEHWQGEDAKHETNIVTLNKESVANITLKTAAVTRRDLDMTLRAAGRVELDLNKTARLSSTVEGKVTKLPVDLNQPVKANERLVVIESPELLGKQLELKSPIDGTIVSRPVSVGETVDRFKPLITISDLKSLWVIAEIKERDIGAIRNGQSVTFSVLAYPDTEFNGQVSMVGNQVEEDSRTLEVRIEAENSSLLLKPGMFADVSIITTVLPNVLAIPTAAFQTQDESQVVFVSLGDNRYEKRPVQIGLEQSGLVQITSGLSEQDQVVTEGSFILKSELLKGELGEE